MSKWADPEAWERLRSDASCPICIQSKPRGILAELEASYLTAGEDAPMKGYCCLVLQRHAVELFDLGPEEAAAFMRDVQRVARAVHDITGAVKLNYEIHGNTIPHLHMHLYPRYVGDPFEGKPIDPQSVKGPVYGPGEFAAFAERLRGLVG